MNLLEKSPASVMAHPVPTKNIFFIRNFHLYIKMYFDILYILKFTKKKGLSDYDYLLV